MEYNFDNIPGYCTKEEAEIIYSLVREIPASRILEVGCFAGKLTAGLAENFPEMQITAIDSWAYTDFVDPMFRPNNPWGNDKFLGSINTHDVFKKFTSEYQTITSIQSDFLKFTGNYDLIILSLDAKELDWDATIRHAMGMCNKKIIGRHANFSVPYRKGLEQALAKYNTTYYDCGIYIIQMNI